MNGTTDRRAFLHAAAAAIGVGAMSSSGSSAPPDDLAIIDTHQHLWDLRRFRLAWVEKGSDLDRDYLPDDYAAAVKGLNVVKAVYMEVDVVPEQQTAEAEWILELIRSRKTPTVGAVISGRPASADFPTYINRWKETPEIKGVRHVLHAPTTPPGFCLSPEFQRGVRHLGAIGKRFDICIRPAELVDAARLAAECPDTKLILDHCGNADVRSMDRSAWKRDLARVAERPNVVCKVSGIVASARGGRWTADDLAPIVEHVLDTFGADRVMFGGDWPVCTLAATYARWVDALKSIVRNRPAAEVRKLFHDNAARFYGLE